MSGPKVGTIDKEIGGYVVRIDGPWIVAVVPMLFNDRIVLTHIEQYPLFVTAGYCYDKGVGAGVAAQVWNPLTDPRPVGWKKVAYEDTAYYERRNQEWAEKCE
jgi:hypothetical protein